MTEMQKSLSEIFMEPKGRSLSLSLVGNELEAFAQKTRAQ